MHVCQYLIYKLNWSYPNLSAISLKAFRYRHGNRCDLQGCIFVTLGVKPTTLNSLVPISYANLKAGGNFLDNYTDTAKAVTL